MPFIPKVPEMFPVKTEEVVQVTIFVPVDPPLHDSFVITLVSNVTAPVRAYRLPFDVAPVVTVMEICARIFPMKLVSVPKVAELPICQKT